jgi:CRP-like cAMP-binding protein
MSGKVIQTLRKSPLATFLSEAELRMLAGCGRIRQYAAGQNILSADGQEERLFLLREGKVDLQLIVNTETGQCSGDIHVELSLPGEPFGWAAWMRAERVGASARAMGSVSMAAFDLARLEDSEIFLKLSTRMLELLYSRLQEYGICPPNIQALLKMKQLLQRVGET